MGNSLGLPNHRKCQFFLKICKPLRADYENKCGKDFLPKETATPYSVMR